MQTLQFDRVLFADCDDTLITFDFPPKYTNRAIMIGPEGYKRLALPMTKNIEKLKNARSRGHGVVIWTQGGYAWGKMVVDALQLQNYVDLIVTKPSWIYDDLPVEKWMGPRFFTPEFEE